MDFRFTIDDFRLGKYSASVSIANFSTFAPSIVPVALLQSIRRKLEMNGNHIARSCHFQIWLLGNLTILRGVVGAFEIFDGWGEDNCPFGDAVIAIRLQMDLRHRAAHFDGLGVPDEFGRQVLCADEFEQGVLRVCGGENYDSQKSLRRLRGQRPSQFDFQL